MLTKRLLFIYASSCIIMSVFADASLGQNPKTVDDIINVRQARGETVIIYAVATDPVSNMTWMVLQRSGRKFTFSLIKTIGGGADGVLDDPNMLNVLQHHTDINIATSLVQQIVDKNIMEAGGINQMQANISTALAENPNSFSKLSDIAIGAYELRGIVFE